MSQDLQPALQAVVFDMDGLMVDSEPVSRRAWDLVLEAYGVQLADELYGRMLGRRTGDSARMVLAAHALPLTPATLVARKQAVYATLLAQEGVPAMPGLGRLLTVLAQRRLPWGVATSSTRHHAELVLAQLGVAADCAALAAGDEVNRGKPAPDVYLLAAQRLGVPPAACLALEDTAPGSQAALAAGMRVVAIPGGLTRAAGFPGAVVVLPSLTEVADRLDGMLAAGA